MGGQFEPWVQQQQVQHSLPQICCSLNACWQPVVHAVQASGLRSLHTESWSPGLLVHYPLNFEVESGCGWLSEVCRSHSLATGQSWPEWSDVSMLWTEESGVFVGYIIFLYPQYFCSNGATAGDLPRPIPQNPMPADRTSISIIRNAGVLGMPGAAGTLCGDALDVQLITINHIRTLMSGTFKSNITRPIESA